MNHAYTDNGSLRFHKGQHEDDGYLTGLLAKNGEVIFQGAINHETD